MLFLFDVPLPSFMKWSFSLFVRVLLGVPLTDSSLLMWELTVHPFMVSHSPSLVIAPRVSMGLTFSFGTLQFLADVEGAFLKRCWS